LRFGEYGGQDHSQNIQGNDSSLLEEHIPKLNTLDLEKPEESLLKQSPDNVHILLYE
jgi:hypothetical protein